MRAAFAAAVLSAMVVVAFAPTPGGALDPLLEGKEALLELGLAVLLAVAAWRNGLPRLRPEDAVLACLCGWAVLRGLFVVNGEHAARAIAILIAACALHLFGSDASVAERRLHLLAAALGAVALTALLEAWGVARWSAPGFAPGATLGQRNAAAHVLVVGAPLLLSAEVARFKVPLRVVAVASVAVVISSRSRAAWWALAAATVVLLIVLRGRHRWVALGLVAVGVLLGAVPNRLAWESAHPLRDTFQRLVDPASREAQVRRALALVSVGGVGPGQWEIHAPRVPPPDDAGFRSDALRPTARRLNSDGLAVLVELGAPGLALTLLFLVLLVRRVRGPVLAALAAAAVVSGLDAFVQLAAPVAVATLCSGATSPHRGRTFAFRRWAAAVLAVALVGAAVLQARAAVSAWLSAPYDANMAALDRAHRWDPDNLEAGGRLAEALVSLRRCDEGRAVLAPLRARYPFHPTLSALEAECAPIP